MNSNDLNLLLEPVGCPRLLVPGFTESNLYVIDTAMGLAEVWDDISVNALSRPLDVLERRDLTFRFDDGQCRALLYAGYSASVRSCAGGLMDSKSNDEIVLAGPIPRREAWITCREGSGTLIDLADIIKPGDALVLVFAQTGDKTCRPTQRVEATIGVIRDGVVVTTLLAQATPEDRGLRAARSGIRYIA